MGAIRSGSGVTLLGVDVGGTFTDFVGVDETNGAVTVLKVPSTPKNQTEGVLGGLLQMCGGGKGLARIVHGSTVSTNAILEGRGARIALVTTRGFRDTLEIGRCRRLSANIFDIKYVRPPALMPRHLRFEVTERINFKGEVVVPLDETEVEEVARSLERGQVESVAICFLHSYANSAHEERAKALLADRLPKVTICTSSEILPEYLEFERFSTTVVNAFIAPAMQNYITDLAKSLKGVGYASDVYTMASNGGIMSTATTCRFPVRTILSGLAGGINGALYVGRAANVKNLITYDMGGTSTDVCLLENLAPLVTNESIIAGRVVKTPQLEVHTVGAGGGSLAWVDIDGALKVGPQSAGAVPGPSCYGKGGTAATITDANLFLGRLAEGAVLGGQISLQTQPAEKALRHVGEQLGQTDTAWIADGVIRLSVTKMAAAIRKISIERGYDPREFTLMAMGGAGPMHAVQVAEEVGIPEVVVPPWPGNVSALGLLSADLRHDYVKTYLRLASDADPAEMDRLFDEMAMEGLQASREDGVSERNILVSRFADLRFSSQSYALTIPVSDPTTLDELVQAFHQHYSRRYGHDQEGEVELVNLRTVCTGLTTKPSLPQLLNVESANRANTTRQVYFDGQWLATPILGRETLRPGEVIKGPAIIEEFGATTVVPPDWTIHPTDIGVIFIRKLGTEARKIGS